jgi:hypothetical protein
MLIWAYKNGLSLPVPLPAYYERMKARPAVVEGKKGCSDRTLRLPEKGRAPKGRPRDQF